MYHEKEQIRELVNFIQGHYILLKLPVAYHIAIELRHVATPIHVFFHKYRTYHKLFMLNAVLNIFRNKQPIES